MKVLNFRSRMALVAVAVTALGGLVGARPAAASVDDCTVGFICLYRDGNFSGVPHLYSPCGCRQELRAEDHDEVSSWINSTNRNISLGYNIHNGSHLSGLTPGNRQGVVWENDAADFLIG